MAGGEDDGNGADGRKDTDVEPTFYLFLPKVVYPGQGELAKASLERRLPYVGICLSETLELDLDDVFVLVCSCSVHVFVFVLGTGTDFLQRWTEEMVKWTKNAMATEGTALYSPEWAEIAKKDRVIFFELFFLEW